MKVLTKDQQIELREIAERLIGNYILAVEHDDISNPHSWIYDNDHWEIGHSDGMQILKILGASAEEADAIEQDVRLELKEENKVEEEDEDAEV